MSVKRNFPRYKRISKFRLLVRPELRAKILLSFSREKWQRIKRRLFPRKFISYHQDVVNVFLRKKYFIDKITRRKRIYRFLLRDRQRLQFYYGNGRIRYFQLKALALKALKLAKNNDISCSSAFLAVLEHRLAAFLYRLRLVAFLTDARPFVADGYVQVGNTVIKDYNFTLTESSIVTFDPKILYLINYHYLTACVAFFYQKHYKLMNTILSQKRHFRYLPFVNEEKSVKHTAFLFKRFLSVSKRPLRRIVILGIRSYSSSGGDYFDGSSGWCYPDSSSGRIYMPGKSGSGYLDGSPGGCYMPGSPGDLERSSGDPYKINGAPIFSEKEE